MTRSKISNKTIFASLLIISVVLLFTPHRHTRILSDAFARITTPLLSKGPKTAQGFLTLDFRKPENSQSQDFQKLQQEYIALKAAYANVIADRKIIQHQLDKLAMVTSTFPQPGPGLRYAEVTKASLNGTKRQLMINKGTKAGIKNGQYVMAKNNIIGTIIDATQSTATIAFITDADHNIEIMIQRDEDSEPIRGHLLGTGTDSCKIPLLYRKNDIRYGDVVYAAKKMGFLYTPRVVGTVSMVQDSEKVPLLLDVAIRPIIPAQQITEVAVILMNPDLDIIIGK